MLILTYIAETGGRKKNNNEQVGGCNIKFKKILYDRVENEEGII